MAEAGGHAPCRRPESTAQRCRSRSVVGFATAGSAPLGCVGAREGVAGTWRSLVAHLTGGQGVAGSNPVVPTNTGPADDGRNTTSAGFLQVSSRSCWVGDRAQLGTIWGPAGIQEGCQRVAAAVSKNAAAGCGPNCSLTGECLRRAAALQVRAIGRPGQPARGRAAGRGPPRRPTPPPRRTAAGGVDRTLTEAWSLPAVKYEWPPVMRSKTLSTSSGVYQLVKNRCVARAVH